MKNWNSYKDVKVGIYAISADEPEAFIDRWLDSMKGADKIWVLVTKINNPNYDYFSKKAQLPEFVDKLFVSEVNIQPWRFDTARNVSMEAIDNDAVDILICTDIDEILIPEFWDDCRQAVFDHPNYERIFYRYAWSHNDNGEPDRVFWYDKTHQPGMYHWEYPVHETLTRNANATCEGSYYLDENKIYLHHYPDNTKSRGSYLGLLELRAQEYPEDVYGIYYLGREYMFYQQHDKAITTMTQLYLKLRTQGIIDDMQMKPCICNVLGNTYRNYGLNTIAEGWYKQGIEEDPKLRDNYIDLAQMYAWSNCPEEARLILNEMEIKSQYIEDWRTLPYKWSDWKKEQILADIAMWEGDYLTAEKCMNKALHNLVTETDKAYAKEEGFYDDLQFLRDKLN